uniref:Uncharacterized protein n=1 Tax=Lepeophtheirus salmonis TaxID=72036 RepID=A0A0K2V7N2_LEPSM
MRAYAMVKVISIHSTNAIYFKDSVSYRPFYYFFSLKRHKMRILIFVRNHN